MIQDSVSGVQITELGEGLVNNVEVVQEEKLEAEITLYAVVGSPSPGTMRVKDKILRECLIILLDFGSSHNFIDATIAIKLQIPIDTSQILEVKAANGEIIKTKGLCKDVLVVIQGYKFYVQLHVLSLGGCDVVLGTHWLNTLGVISWDFK